MKQLNSWRIYDPVNQRNVIFYDQYEKAYEHAKKMMDKYKGIRLIFLVCDELKITQKIINNFYKCYDWQGYQELVEKNAISDFFCIGESGQTIYFIKTKRNYKK